MAEESSGQGVSNVVLVVVSVALGMAAALVYNLHVRAIRNEGKGDLVAVVRASRNIEPGEEITSDHLEEVSIPRDLMDSIGKVVKRENAEIVLGTRPSRQIKKGEYILHTDLGQVGGTEKWSDESKSVFTIEFDPRTSPGQLLKKGDYVDVYGIVDPPNGDRKTYRVLSAVKVEGVEGQSIDTRRSWASPGSDNSPSRYRSIQILLEPEVIKQFGNVKTWVDGSLTVAVLHPNMVSRRRDAGQINPDLRNLSARSGASGGSDPAW
jgi:Flp pilus assembly protein CpaB